MLLRIEYSRAGELASLREHGLGSHEGWRDDDLVAEHEAVQVQVVAVDLPAPRLALGRRAEDADPVQPLAILLPPLGDLADRVVQPHDVAGGGEAV